MAWDKGCVHYAVPFGVIERFRQLDYSNLPVFVALQKRQQWLQQRQSVLAENVANADTPGYKPRDLVPVGFRELLKDRFRVDQAVTDPRHISTPSQTGPGRAKTERKFESAPSGNAVNLDTELAKVAETQLEYQTVLNLYRKQASFIRTALGRGTGQ